MDGTIRFDHILRFSVFKKIKKKVECLRCGKTFNSESKFNKVCTPCRKINEDIPEELRVVV